MLAEGYRRIVMSVLFGSSSRVAVLDNVIYLSVLLKLVSIAVFRPR
jgi:hypothetical protein